MLLQNIKFYAFNLVRGSKPPPAKKKIRRKMIYMLIWRMDGYMYGNILTNKEKIQTTLQLYSSIRKYK